MVAPEIRWGREVQAGGKEIPPTNTRVKVLEKDRYHWVFTTIPATYQGKGGQSSRKVGEKKLRTRRRCEEAEEDWEERRAPIQERGE